jgi:hypothetical protein
MPDDAPNDRIRPAAPAPGTQGDRGPEGDSDPIPGDPTLHAAARDSDLDDSFDDDPDQDDQDDDGPEHDGPEHDGPEHDGPEPDESVQGRSDAGTAAHAAGRPLRRFRRRKAPVERKKLSTMLEEIGADTSRDRISVADLISAMDARAFGALLLIFAFPNALPAPPGTSGILGLPLLYLAAQMMLARKPWLPKLIAARSMARTDFVGLVDRINPWLTWADRFMAPRLQFLVSPQAQRVLGAFMLVLSIVLVLPIPLGNMLPAFAICMIALGVLERDGLWILIGITIGLGALVIAWAVVYALVRATIFLILRAF